jgi:hypothetical protein
MSWFAPLLVDALISNTIVLCRALLVLLLCVELVSIDVIPLPRGDLGGWARRKPRFIRLSTGYVLQLFDPRRETDLMLFLDLCLHALSVMSDADFL